MRRITYTRARTRARADFARLCGEVAYSGEIVIVTRRGEKDVALIVRG
jgi:hypothetical protein